MFASRRRGTPRICGAERTESAGHAKCQCKSVWIREGGGEGHTEYFPPFTEPLAVVGIDHVRDGVAIVVVPMPDVADPTLAAEVPELEDGGWEGDFSRCGGLLSEDVRGGGEVRTVLPDGGADLIGGEAWGFVI